MITSDGRSLSASLAFNYEPYPLIGRKRVMSAVVIEETVRVPDWVKNLESFRRWYLSDDFPDFGVISYIQKEVWLDLRMEELAHNQVKGEIAFVLTGAA